MHLTRHARTLHSTHFKAQVEDYRHHSDGCAVWTESHGIAKHLQARLSGSSQLPQEGRVVRGSQYPREPPPLPAWQDRYYVRVGGGGEGEGFNAECARL